MTIYVVQEGDTVDEIAAKTGADLNTLLETNQLEYPYRLAIGQALLLFAKGERQMRKAVKGRPLAESNGYAYPFISEWILGETLPFLSELSVFSYGFTAKGELLPPTLDDKWMVEQAIKTKTSPTLTLTPLGVDGRFNNSLVSALVRQESVQMTLLRNLVGEMTQKGYGGVNIDFEYVLSEDRDAFTDFVRRATNLLNPFGYYVTVALAPKYSDNQAGLLYEGMDYGGL